MTIPVAVGDMSLQCSQRVAHYKALPHVDRDRVFSIQEGHSCEALTLLVTGTWGTEIRSQAGHDKGGILGRELVVSVAIPLSLCRDRLLLCSQGTLQTFMFPPQPPECWALTFDMVTVKDTSEVMPWHTLVSGRVELAGLVVMRNSKDIRTQWRPFSHHLMQPAEG